MEVPELSVFKAGLMVAGVPWGKCTFSMMAGPPVLYLISMFQFLGIEGVRGCRRVERVRV